MKEQDGHKTKVVVVLTAPNLTRVKEIQKEYNVAISSAVNILLSSI